MTSASRITAVVLGAVLSLLAVASSRATPQEDAEALQRNAPRIAAIISKVARPDGHIDRGTHTEFWALLPQTIREDPSSFVANLDVVRAMVYQKELWESIRLSARAGTIVKTLAYASAMENALGEGPEARDAAHRADEMLTAAATGKPFQSRTGTPVLTEDLANQVLDGLNSSTARLQLLTNPVWQGPASHP